MAGSLAVVDDPPDAEELLALYRTYDWWADRDGTDLERALAATDLFVGLRERTDPGECGEDGRLVAAARVLTDGVYYASVYDVVVAPDYRGEGAGRRLLEEVVDHPVLAKPDVDRRPGIDLLCREGLVEFYEACGFEPGEGPVAHPDGAAERLRRMVYRREQQ